MKEFAAQTGGRYVYIEDILNLQNLSLAFSNMFSGCGNFIISGCQLVSGGITEGYVNINGKIRYCASSSTLSTWPIYITEHETDETITYADSNVKVGRKIYDTVINTVAPTDGSQYITMAQDGTTVRMKDAFFGKYSLILDPQVASQSVNKPITFNGKITASGAISSVSPIDMTSGTYDLNFSYDTSGNLSIQSKISDTVIQKITVSVDGAFGFYRNGVLLASLTKDYFQVNVNVLCNYIKGGNIVVTGNNIYNSGVGSDDGKLSINMLGYNGLTGYFLGTEIGDGKGNTFAYFDPKNSVSTVYSPFYSSSSLPVGFGLNHNTLPKTDLTLTKYILFSDKDKSSMATLGYTSITDANFYINNSIGNLVLQNNVNVTGVFSVGGIDISQTYATNAALTSLSNAAAISANVYSKTDADNRFAKLSGGFTQLITAIGGDAATAKATLCDQIGALNLVGVTNNCAIKTQLFADMVANGLNTSSPTYTTDLDTRKRALCTNIGAAYATDTQAKLKDTGWILISTGLYVRQIGNIVNVQGNFVDTGATGTLYSLPTSIDPPTYGLSWEYTSIYSGDQNYGMQMQIDAGSRDIKVLSNRRGNGYTHYISQVYFV